MKVIPIVVLFAAVLLTGCASSTHEHEPSPLKGNAEVLTETARLASLAQANTITEGDFATLRVLVAPDAHLAEEVNEVITMVRYKEYVHAGHGLAFVSSFVQKGGHPVCPGHSLAHYYVYARHGEVELAADALAEAKAEFPNWKSGAREQLEAFPGPRTYKELEAQISANIAAIERGTANPTDDEITELANLLCVDE